MTNFKLQYRLEEPNHWFGGVVPEKPEFSALELLSPAVDTDTIIKKYESDLQLAIAAFKPIAPQDQKKVTKLIIEFSDADPSKLYDSGDLEFELKRQRKIFRNNNWEWVNTTLDFIGHEYREVWVLKEKKCQPICDYPNCTFDHCKLKEDPDYRTVTDKVQVEPKVKFSTLEEDYSHPLTMGQIVEQETALERQHSEAKDVHEFLLNKGIDSEIKIGEHFLTDLLESFTQLYSKQLQSRIAELEEQRERLIAKLMNAEDKIKKLESAPEYVKGHADGYVDGYAQAKNDLQGRDKAI